MKRELTVLEVLFPKVRAEVLRLLFGTPSKARFVRELANLSELAVSTVQEELRRLTALGLLVTWSDGFHRFYRPDRRHVLYPSLAEIVRISFRTKPISRSEVVRLRRRHFKRRVRPTGQGFNPFEHPLTTFRRGMGG